jgi:RNA polymerase subunit RPABC4/transcription elongation factor Spt4
MTRRSYSDSKFKEEVAKNYSVASVLRSLGLKPIGGNYKTFHRIKQELGVNTDHFTGMAHLKGKTHNWSKAKPLSEVLVEDSLYTSNGSLKKRLLKAGLLEYRCNECGIVDWNNGSLSLHLDHINGKNRDHRLENLRLLCPNCHSQTSTWTGRNIGAYGGKRTENILHKKKTPESAQCKVCKKKVSWSAKHCKKHRPRQTKINWPDVESLIAMVENSSFLVVSRKLGVSDNAIRKRIETRSAASPKDHQ